MHLKQKGISYNIHTTSSHKCSSVETSLAYWTDPIMHARHLGRGTGRSSGDND